MPAKKYETKIGDKFERLTVTGEVIKKGVYRYVPCICNCGKITTPRIGELFSGSTKSCGCLGAEIRVRAHLKHGHTGKRIYQTWKDMMHRCFNQKRSSYKYYGARGITVCEEWLEYLSFYKWAMPHGYKDKLSIERIDNNLGYSPDNCIFIPRSKQSSNRRCCPSVNIDGKTFSTLKAAARYFKIGYHTVRRRLKIGWSLRKALKAPLQNRVQIEVSGKKFPSFAAAARYFGIDYDAAYHMHFCRGVSVEDVFGV